MGDPVFLALEGPSPQTSQAEENFNPFRTIPGSIMQSNYVRWSQPWDVVFLCENVTPFRRRTWLAPWRPCHEGGRVHPRLSPGDHDLPVKRSWVLRQNFMAKPPVPWGLNQLCQLRFWSAFRPQIRTALNGSHWMFAGWRNWHEQIFGIQVKEINLITLITDGEAAKIRTNIERTWSNTCFDL